MFGTVIWYNEVKKYGFIKPDGASPDGNIFVHMSQVPKESGRRFLRNAERVSFDVTDGKGGKVAANVQRIREDEIKSASASSDGVGNERN